MDLFSDVSDTDILKNLLAELHDDLCGRLSRFRFLIDIGATLGSQGTMIYGGHAAALARAWRRLHHISPPLGLSRDLIIRGLADKLQQRAHGGPSRALQRRLQILAGEFEKGARSFDPGGVLKTGATLVRQWRGHTHTVLVRENGFEYDGQRYRSLTVIAERFTGAHWSGPRFFGLNKRARES